MYKASVERLYSKRQIKQAGKLLGNIVQKNPETIEAFQVLHNWRFHHAYPMLRERAKLTRIVKPLGGITAGRLKRTSSIRKKLFRGTTKLEQMQDLVGCRAIVNSMDDICSILERYKLANDGGDVRRINDYISTPKPSGYRSIHLVVKFNEKGTGEKHIGCNVEIQLRTQLQHVWSTTVEAAGSMLNQDLKAGEGSEDWLSFFSLMSGHIAELEGLPRSEILPGSHKEIIEKIRYLENKLSVRQQLSAFNEFMNQAESDSSLVGSKFILRMDVMTGDVSVSPAWREMFEYDDLDDDFEETKQSLEVSVDNMTALRQAYPNYFADTHTFIDILKEIQSPKQKAKKNTLDSLDYSFLSNFDRNKNKLSNKDDRPKGLPELRDNGWVYCDGDPVGRWSQGSHGSYFFLPGNENYHAFQCDNVLDFQKELLRWFSAK